MHGHGSAQSIHILSEQWAEMECPCDEMQDDKEAADTYAEGTHGLGESDE